MKIILSILTLTFVGYNFSQFKIESSFNSVHIGRNQSVCFVKDYNRHHIYAGIKYSFNKLDPPINWVFKKKFYATNFSERLGLQAGYGFNVIHEKKYSVFAFYDLQITRSHIRQFSYLVASGTNPSNLLYSEHTNIFGPYWAVENHIGFGIRVNLFSNFYFTNKLGIGIVYYNGNQPQFAPTSTWEFADLISFGLGWNFNQNKE